MIHWQEEAVVWLLWCHLWKFITESLLSLLGILVHIHKQQHQQPHSPLFSCCGCCSVIAMTWVHTPVWIALNLASGVFFHFPLPHRDHIDSRSGGWKLPPQGSVKPLSDPGLHPQNRNSHGVWIKVGTWLRRWGSSVVDVSPHSWEWMF